MIINCVSYKNGERLNSVEPDNISEVLKDPGTFVWLGLYEPDRPLLKKIQEEFTLHDLAVEDVTHAHQRPKLERYGDHLFIVVKTTQLDQENILYGETHFFIGKNFLISIRHGTSSNYSGIREHCETTPKILSKGPSFALYALLDFIVDNYRNVVSHSEIEFEKLEADIFNRQLNPLDISRLYEFKSRLLKIRSSAMPIEEICNQLMRFHEDIIPQELQVYFRDIQDHASHVVNMADNLREMANTAIQVNLGIAAFGQNDIVKRLAGWGAILAIPTLIFSLYGMNFQTMPELHWHYGYHATLGITIICCVALYQKLKKSGWL